jgi:hypothetical protein
MIAMVCSDNQADWVIEKFLSVAVACSHDWLIEKFLSDG